MGLLNSLAILQAQVTEKELHGMLESTTGWIFSTYAFFLYFCGAQVGTWLNISRVTTIVNKFADMLLGPIFDAHDVKFLIIPGTVGMVVSLVSLSFSNGTGHKTPLSDTGLMYLRSRVLPIFTLIRRTWWYLCVPAL